MNSESENKPWGFWATLLFSVLLVFAFLLTQSFAASLVLFPQLAEGTLDLNNTQDLEQNGLLLSVSTLMTALTTVLLSCLYAYIKNDISIKNYLALRVPKLRPYLIWFVIIGTYLVFNDWIYLYLGRDPVHSFARKTYASAPIKSLYFLALTIGAPLGEEFLMRGFMFKGFLRSPLRLPGTLILTSVLWAVSHLQYDVLDMALIFGGGILLGLARYYTHSLLTPLTLHALWNTYACVQVVYF